MKKLFKSAFIGLILALVCVVPLYAAVSIIASNTPTMNDLAFNPQTTSGLNYGYKAGNVKIFYSNGEAGIVRIKAGVVSIPVNQYPELGTFTVWAVAEGNGAVMVNDGTYIQNGVILARVDVSRSLGRIVTVTDLRSWLSQGTGDLGVLWDELSFDGMRILGTDNVLPQAIEANRGKLFFLQGENGVADQLYVCMKDAAGNYSWVLK